jgi:hypothetical protein
MKLTLLLEALKCNKRFNKFLLVRYCTIKHCDRYCPAKSNNRFHWEFELAGFYCVAVFLIMQ